MTTFFYTHPACLEHEPGAGHPDAPVRLKAIVAEVERADLIGLERREAPQASRLQLARIHPPAHIERILALIPAEGQVRIDADTVVSPGSREAALRAAGAACAAVDAVASGEAANAFCAIRPPGHHAEPERAMGFCLFNNVAIAAAHARAEHGLARIAIVDVDVHHGNGTQAAFWDDPDTLYLSTHQSPLYPGTGAREERGAHGNVVNLPLPMGTGSLAWRKVVEAEILPAIDAFAPDLILLSAGFDAHRADPLADMGLVEEDYAWVTRELLRLAGTHAGGRLVSVLEGGYDPRALARSVVAHLQALVDG
jgi:acetoin utilization deacetylase AcuC-like enzyme